MSIQAPDPTSETLKTGLNMIASAADDVIVAGGASSSTLLNQLRTNLLSDLLELDNRTNALSAQTTMAAQVWNGQLTSLASRLQALENRLPTASGKWMADMFTTDFIDGGNTATVNTTYGQATLPILTAQEKLVGRDSRDQVWIPAGASLLYSYVGTAPQETDWLPDDNSVFALDQRTDTAWWAQRAASGTVWVRVILPANLNSNKLANCIILHPYPVFAFDLVSVESKSAAGVYTAADISYLEGYNSNTQTVQGMGNVRLFIPQSQVVELRIKLSVPSLWGFAKVSVQQIEFAPTATLAVNFSGYNPPSISSSVLVGKDPNALAYLNTQINGAVVSVALVQNAANSSPIITQCQVSP